MGAEYAKFHLRYTVPIATALTFLYYPFVTRREKQKILFIITIAVAATLPWDSYLIRTNTWHYPEHAVLDWKLLQVPLEEVFFFVIQTYTTSLLYCIVTKPLLWPIYLRATPVSEWKRNVGSAVLAAIFSVGVACVCLGGHYTYLGLIIVWTCPVVTFQWTQSHDYILALPLSRVTVPIWLPTIYLWVADSWAIRQGTWVITTETKLGIQLWPGLELEEAIFFALTNVMVVLGLVFCDYAFALQNQRILSATSSQSNESFCEAVMGLILPRQDLNLEALDQLSEASALLHDSSQSMSLGSAMFPEEIRYDLILLYRFCRVLDDVVDKAEDSEETRSRIEFCSLALDARFDMEYTEFDGFANRFESQPQQIITAIKWLPSSRMSKGPFKHLLEGFETDLAFDLDRRQFPIRTESDLELYASRVASTIAELALEIIFHHRYKDRPIHPPDCLSRLIEAGRQMGKALQYVNIARDIHRDAAIGRVYIPQTWLDAEGITALDVIKNPSHESVYTMQTKLLDRAEELYRHAQPSIEYLPYDVQRPLKATIESYMEIGRQLRTASSSLETPEKFQLPLVRRLIVAWKAMK